MFPCFHQGQLLSSLPESVPRVAGWLAVTYQVDAAPFCLDCALHHGAHARSSTTPVPSSQHRESRASWVKLYPRVVICDQHYQQAGFQAELGGEARKHSAAGTPSVVTLVLESPLPFEPKASLLFGSGWVQSGVS